MLGGALLLLAGLAGVGFGLLFLLGSDGQGHRLVVAAVGLLVGGGAVLAGAWLIHEARRWSPVVVMAEVMALARERDGQLLEEDLEAALGPRTAVARGVLKELSRAERVRVRSASEGGGWVFPGLMPRLLLRRCAHCGHEAPLSSEAVACPSCGSTLELSREALPADGGLYSMDD